MAFDHDKWYRANRERIMAYKREWRAKLRQKALEHLGGKCKKCGFKDVRALQIDHVNGGGQKELRSFGRSETYYKVVVADKTGKYQLLCANCNWIKRFTNNEINH